MGAKTGLRGPQDDNAPFFAGRNWDQMKSNQRREEGFLAALGMTPIAALSPFI